MKIQQVKDVLAERMANKSTQYTQLIKGGLDLEPRNLSVEQIDRIRSTHELMGSFALDISKRPLAVDQIASKYFAQYTKFLSQSLPEQEDLEWDAYFAVVGMYALNFSESLSTTISNLREFMEIFCGPVPFEKVSCTDDLFWPLLEMLLISLEIDDALELLNFGFSADDVEGVPAPVLNVVGELALALKQYPAHNPQATKQEFWDWRRVVLGIADHAASLPLAWGPSIARVCAILSGKRDAGTIRHWIQAVIAQFAYFNPEHTEWKKYVKSIPGARPALEGDAPDWEGAVAKVMDGRVFSAVLNLQRLDTCSAVVCAEFYFRTNQLQLPFQSTPSLREYLALCHALECLCCPELVTTGVDMLINMETPYSREILGAALPHLGLEGPDTRDEVLRLTRDQGLTEARTEFHIKIADYELRHLNYVEALCHYYAAGDLQGMKDMTWTAFETMLVDGKVEASPDTLEVLRSNAPEHLDRPVAECIAPLAILTSILDNATEDAMTSIDGAVHTLLSINWVPHKYYPLIIAYAGGLVGDEATLATMMRALHKWEQNPDEGIKLLEASREHSLWAQGLDPNYTSKEVVSMLRRKLSESVFA